MAYIVMPLIFMIMGYGIVALIFSPHFDTIYAAGNLLIVDDRSIIAQGIELRSVFDEDAAYITAAAIDDYNTLHISDIDMPNYGDHYAELRNRRIGLAAPVFLGDDYEILRYGVGHYFGSWLPGFGGTILLSGHNYLHFHPLQHFEIDDIVQLQTNYGLYEYLVVDIDIFTVSAAEEMLDLGQMEQEILLLYTCYPFDAIQVPEYRIFIFAEKISGPVIDFMAQEY